jgi:hypothetical protein
MNRSKLSANANVVELATRLAFMLGLYSMTQPSTIGRRMVFHY